MRVQAFGLLVAILVLACAPAASSPPASEPHVRGEITRVTASEITVEEIPGESRGAKAVVTLTADTVIESASGGRLRAGDLRTGQMARVWFAGEVMQSYPLQGAASRLVVE